MLNNNDVNKIQEARVYQIGDFFYKKINLVWKHTYNANVKINYKYTVTIQKLRERKNCIYLEFVRAEATN